MNFLLLIFVFGLGFILLFTMVPVVITFISNYGIFIALLIIAYSFIYPKYLENKNKPKSKTQVKTYIEQKTTKEGTYSRPNKDYQEILDESMVNVGEYAMIYVGKKDMGMSSTFTPLPKDCFKYFVKFDDGNGNIIFIESDLPFDAPTLTGMHKIQNYANIKANIKYEPVPYKENAPDKISLNIDVDCDGVLHTIQLVKYEADYYDYEYEQFIPQTNWKDKLTSIRITHSSSDNAQVKYYFI